jgi:membrane-associated phospholipid phosphatase
MKTCLVFVVLCSALPLCSQDNQTQPPANQPPANQPPANQSSADQPPASPGQQTPSQTPPTQPAPAQNGISAPAANPSALGVKPGTEALKNKDLYEGTGYLHPFRRMSKFVLTDQKRIWTSPFHTKKSDAKYWAIFGGATAALIATDKYVSHAAPNPSWLEHLGDDVSYLGEPYTLLPIAAGFYFYGSAKGHERFREAGLLSFETLANVTILELVLKSITNRDRPLEGNGNGLFFTSQSPRWDSSFPSGHAIETFALASVFAHEYHDKFWVKFLAYAYAGGVVGARLAANKHFPGDVMAGGAMGWFTGDYVYAKRHNPGLDTKRSITQKIFDHVRIAMAY